MKRTQIPVLLVIMVLLSFGTLAPSVAWADDDGSAILRPDSVRQDDLIAGTTGDGDNDAKPGDPDNLGDGFGFSKSGDLLGEADSCESSAAPIWLKMMIRAMEIIKVVR